MKYSKAVAIGHDLKAATHQLNDLIRKAAQMGLLVEVRTEGPSIQRIGEHVVPEVTVKCLVCPNDLEIDT